MLKMHMLTDYQGHFGSKATGKIVGAGMDKEKLKQYFNEAGFEVYFHSFAELLNNSEKIWFDDGNYFLYTSSEDEDYYYKGFIEDTVHFIELNHGTALPAFKYLRATNNKLLMELLYSQVLKGEKHIKTQYFGTLEDLLKVNPGEFNFPLVVKSAGGAGSRGVALAGDYRQLMAAVKKLSKTRITREFIKDNLRPFKYKGYLPHSRFRNKFIVQTFIPGLDSDFKMLVFGDKYYVVQRGVRKNDFRASGSGILNFNCTVNPEMLDFAEQVFESFEVPFLSLDIAFDGEKYYIIELQFVHFGPLTLEKSTRYFSKNPESKQWVENPATSELEKEYVCCIHRFLEKYRK